MPNLIVFLIILGLWAVFVVVTIAAGRYAERKTGQKRVKFAVYAFAIVALHVDYAFITGTLHYL
jgi:hypothetical protein